MCCLIISQSFHQISEKAGYIRHEKRPRVLVLVPTRELATQVLQEVYSFPLLLIVNCALFHCFERMFPISPSFITVSSSQVKQISHFTKVSSTAVLGGEVYTTQKKAVSDGEYVFVL